MWFRHGALWVLISELDLHYLSEAKFWFQNWSIVLLVGWLGNCRQGRGNAWSLNLKVLDQVVGNL